MMRDYRVKCISEKGKYCYICGDEENIDVHHIDGDRTNNKLNNLIPVCRYCHTGIHKKRENYEHWHARLLPWYNTSGGEFDEDRQVNEESTPKRILIDNLIFINGLTSSTAKEVARMENGNIPFQCPDCGNTRQLNSEYSLKNRKTCSACDWVGAVCAGTVEAIGEGSESNKSMYGEATE